MYCRTFLRDGHDDFPVDWRRRGVGYRGHGLERVSMLENTRWRKRDVELSGEMPLDMAVGQI